ncbi:MAG: TPM domain-containing protein [Pyrinomonadaceae bacterium]
MKPSRYRHLGRGMLFIAAFFLSVSFLHVIPRAQQKPQLPARTGYMNDFAGVVDEKTRQRLDTILENVKKRSGIELDVATVLTTGNQDIFDFSRQLANEWDLGARNSSKKSLLLVVAVNEKAVFTQFSRSVQNELPEGILGELSQRLRGSVDAGQLSKGLSDGVDHLVTALAMKLGFSLQDIDQVQVAAAPSNPIVSDPPATVKASGATEVIATAPPVKTATNRDAAPAASRSRSAAPNKVNSPGDDEAESEEVELTLTLPLSERVVKLKELLEAFPNSKARPRAVELLISSYAGLGDQLLKKGDSKDGIDQLMLAITEAPVNMSEKLFSGVLAQIPLNLYFRGYQPAAFDAAQMIEAKFGSDPKRLLAIANFYLGIEHGDQVARIATQAVKLAPDSAEAHQVLGLGLHISLRLDEAAAEYKRALELDPNSKKGTRRSLADLNRAAGKGEEALALYREQLTLEPADKAARAGMILSLLDLGRMEEGNKELATGLQEDPRNLALLVGAAYWFAAHNNSERALELARRAVEVEPRYTWSQIAMARALIGQKRPLEAERALRFARQYGKFPTLDYELANALAAAGLYEEAAEVLLQSFTLKEGQIETRLAGRTLARESDFIKLLAPERRAGIFQSTAADDVNNASMLKALLAFTIAKAQVGETGSADEANVTAAAREFSSGPDDMRAYRQLYAASRLVARNIALPTAYELTEAAKSSVDPALGVPAVTVAVQADEFRDIRARSIAQGGTPDIPEAPKNVLSNILRGRIEDIAGWTLFNQDKTEEALDRLKRAANILPEGTPSWRTALWHLGAALDQAGNKQEALGYYIKSYNSGEPDPIRRAVIERLYQKTNGSLDGLDERIGAKLVAANLPPEQNKPVAAVDNPTPMPEPAVAPSVEPTPASSPAVSPVSSEAAPAMSPAATPTPESSPAATTPAATPSPETSPAVTTPAATPSPESSPAVTTPAATPTPESSPTATTPAATPSPESSPTPTPEAPASAPTPQQNPTAQSPESLPEIAARLRSTVKISGRVKDASSAAIPNVVVILISPRGTVLATTTDSEGNYSFIVAPSQKNYRIIPSKDEYNFEPLDKVLAAFNADQKDVDFVGAPSRAP